jgi:hypothetical protein
MIRLTWRQLRTPAAVAGAALAAIFIVVAITGLHLAHLYDTTVAVCQPPSDCSAVATTFLRTDATLRSWLGILVIVGPGLIGMFWGAPLVARELETGTFRLAWTQSVTRTRWLAVKLGVTGLAAVAVAGVLSLMVTWWASPLDRVAMDRFGAFDQRDVVPLGYAAFAFLLGVTAGAVIRRIVPAMATTLVAFVTVRLAFIHWLRPHLFTPAVRNQALDPLSTGYGSSGSLFHRIGASTLQPATPHIPNAWIIATRIVDNAGHGLTSKVLNTDCPDLGSGGPGPSGGPSRGPVPAFAQQRLRDCVVKVGATYHQMVSYQPANRYWALQWYELALFLVAATVLAGGCWWWVRHRLG